MLLTDIGCSWQLVNGPSVEPITLAEAKAQALITISDSDGLIASYIKAAREEAEQYMGRGLYTQIWKATFDWFANVMPLPMAAPMQVTTIASVDYPKVEYYDETGNLQQLATSVYDTDLVRRPAAIVLKPGQSWPSVQSERRNGRVVVTYVVGWSAVPQIPERIKQGIRFFVTYLDCDRNGMETEARDARRAAERCWSDRIEWTPPTSWP